MSTVTIQASLSTCYHQRVVVVVERELKALEEIKQPRSHYQQTPHTTAVALNNRIALEKAKAPVGSICTTYTQIS
jgi:hypothetical protein